MPLDFRPEVTGFVLGFVSVPVSQNFQLLDFVSVPVLELWGASWFRSGSQKPGFVCSLLFGLDLPKLL